MTTPDAATAALRVIARCLQAGQQRRELIRNPKSELYAAVEAVLEFLAANPADSEVLDALADMLSQRYSEADGVVILLMLAQRRELAHGPDRVHSEAATQDDVEKAFEAFLAQLPKVAPVSGESILLDPFAPRPLPPELLEKDHLALVQRIIELLSAGAWLSLSDSASSKELIYLLALANDLADRAGDRRAVPAIARLLACGMASAGLGQDARDLTSSLLQWAGEDRPHDLRRRAWGAYADVLERLQRPIHALIGWLVATSMRETLLPPPEVARELLTIARVERDLGLTRSSLSRVRAIRSMVSAGQIAKYTIARLDTFEATLRFKGLLEEWDNATRDRQLLELEGIGELLIHSLYAEGRAGGEVAPALGMLAQVIRQSQLARKEVPEHWRLALDFTLEKCGEPLTSRIRLLEKPVITRAELADAAARAAEGRLAAEVGTDTMHLGLHARRFLSACTGGEDAAWAIELLMCHAIPLQAVRVEPPKSALQRDLAEPISLRLTLRRWVDVLASIQAVSKDRCITLAALADDGALACVQVLRGIVGPPLRSPAFEEKLANWRKGGRPYSFGLPAVRRDAAHFEEAMSTISFDGIELPRNLQHTFVVAGPISRVPVQLLTSAGEFLGRGAPVAVAPSLTWLFDAMHRTPVRGQIAAWLMGDTAPPDSALGKLHRVMRDCGDDHGFAVKVADLPDESTEALDLVLVGAHGVPSQFGLSAIAGEDGKRLPLPLFPLILRGAHVVVLLVCGGGQQAMEMGTSTVIGLPFELLQNGVRAVVASHWQLDTDAVSAWLPSFLEFWERGLTVSQAVLAANTRLYADPRFSGPADSLAMLVFGDPDATTTRDGAPQTVSQPPTATDERTP